MRIFGSAADCRFRGLRQTPGPLDEPLFAPGSEVGCLVLHGLGGTPANVRITADALAGAGYTVFSPMLAGHGAHLEALHRVSWQDWCRTVEDGLARLRAAGCTRLYVIGLSLGGLLSGFAAEQGGLSGCVMICPPVYLRAGLRIAAVISPLFPFVALGDRDRRDAYANMLAGIASEKLRDVAALGRLFRQKADQITCPLLTIEAGLDNKVSPRSYPFLRKHAVHAALEQRCFAKALHGCTFEEGFRDEVALAVLDFVRKAEQA